MTARTLLVALCLFASACGRGKGEIGVEECDGYLKKYEKCVAGHVPGERKKDFAESLKRTRAAWSTMAQTPGARPGLAQACNLALDAAKATMAEYRCDW
jgi:hypothetical protein